MKSWQTVLVLVSAAMAPVANAVPMGSPNSSTMIQSAPVGTRSSAATDTAVGNGRPKVQYFLVSAEVTVDDKGRPTQVKLTNPTGDEWVNRKLTQELRRRRFTPPLGDPAPTAGTFTVVTRVQVIN